MSKDIIVEGDWSGGILRSCSRRRHWLCVLFGHKASDPIEDEMSLEEALDQMEEGEEVELVAPPEYGIWIGPATAASYTFEDLKFVGEADPSEDDEG